MFLLCTKISKSKRIPDPHRNEMDQQYWSDKINERSFYFRLFFVFSIINLRDTTGATNFPITSILICPLLCETSRTKNPENNYLFHLKTHERCVGEISIDLLYINLACLFVCLFVSNKRQNGWTDWTQIFCGTSRDHREGLWMIKI